MSDPTPASPALQQALDEGLEALFAGMQAEPVPRSLIRLADRLETASRRMAVSGEARALA